MTRKARIITTTNVEVTSFPLVPGVGADERGGVEPLHVGGGRRLVADHPVGLHRLQGIGLTLCLSRGLNPKHRFLFFNLYM